jgi:hypothetical protein
LRVYIFDVHDIVLPGVKCASLDLADIKERITLLYGSASE